MNILDGLLGEHAAMLTMFEHLEQGAARMDLERLHEAGLLLERMVMTHSIAEDRYLFDVLPDVIWEKPGGLRDVLLVMRAEHKQLGHEFDELRETGIEAAARGCLCRVIDAVREHFEVEERVLFQVVAKQMSRRDLEELGSAWKRHRMKEALA